MTSIDDVPPENMPGQHRDDQDSTGNEARDDENRTSETPADETPADETPTDENWDGDQFDLDARLALTRVPGMSTDLSDITEVEYRTLRLERVVLASVWTEGSAEDAQNAMEELKLLAETAGSQVLDGLIQRRPTPDPATYIGSGKVEELKEVVVATGADTVICDGELDGAQLRNLEDRVGVKVIDRTILILDIFAQHASSVEGKTQVELAQLQYMKQRLRGWGHSLSRQAGGRAAAGAGIGGRGPGETKIETDRRRINTRISRLRRKLRAMHSTRQEKRADRTRNAIPSVAIVGYTNAGKSSLLNRLTRAGVLVEDALFATLDPTTRRATAEDGRVYTLTDTVGFVRHLPLHLVEAFASTLEETAQADLLVHVVDAAAPDPAGQVAAVHQVLSGIGAGELPELLVLNKADLLSSDDEMALRATFPGALLVSAHSGEGIEELVSRIEEGLPVPEELVDAVLPYQRGDLVDRIHRLGTIVSVEHTGEGTHVVAHLHPGLAAEVRAAAVAAR
ncbi:GTPase HflX [Acidipropionibacterium jensenii]|uniref:GTPase HflX n=2 Tax=Acidipropionibacterium jensenii TaxID=1749 RepID=UPI002649109B|nr:GTPase HflX [Acidipropionibacterium jensenii]MDN5976158.1 GTPase HflX [Acidipropionibacterium jensenii]MDN5995972.1 GTPase HflX [Acidipropionibacterium jensenii]MDN6425924.1 GTPase HflX [Acidipropionibacterium jensenii]MDN6480133.1 GTPase HflX [Acidipropionibacterium jensenii]MDN6512616.1 GTPase HflX [Acidipropionibacterium jensenii]